MSAKCFKCKSATGTVASRDGAKKPYCTECFVGYVDHVARDALHKHCRLPHTVPVAVAVSGGATSMALLEVLKKTRERNLSRGPASLTFDFRVVHLVEMDLCNTAAEAAANRAIVQAAALRCGFPFTEVNLADPAVVPPALKHAILGAGPLTDREELYSIAKHRALAAAAATAGCTHLVTGENAVRLACVALSAVVRGRGASLAEEAGYVGEVEARDSSGTRTFIKVYRPMCGVLPSECVMYCRFNGLPYHYSRTLATLSTRPSINNAIEKFVATVSVGFKSTVFNILNSMHRLQTAFPSSAMAFQSDPAKTMCVVCATALASTTSGEGEVVGAAASPLGPMCYGCRITWRSFASEEVQPGDLPTASMTTPPPGGPFGAAPS